MTLNLSVPNRPNRHQRKARFQPGRPARIYWPQRRQRKSRTARCVHACGFKGVCVCAHVGTSTNAVVYVDGKPVRDLVGNYETCVTPSR